MSQQIGRYEIVRELGRGAMGTVFHARDPQIGRDVAIKTILTANFSPEELAEYKQRFYREARAAGQMSHPGIVTIHDITEDAGGQPYLVMEFVEGVTLDKMIGEEQATERLALTESAEIARQVALALDYAHRRGVVHRDIKPSNILVTPERHAKIADFGIAKVSGTKLTQTGHVLGTPAYMSPEQFSGGAVDARSDIFSLGAMIYWMVTGEKPFAGDTFTAVSFKVVYTDPVPASHLNPALPRDVDRVLNRCLAKNPDNRYANCAALAADLEALKAGQSIADTQVTIPRPARAAQAGRGTPAAEPPTEDIVPSAGIKAGAARADVAPKAEPRKSAEAQLARWKTLAGVMIGLLVLAAASYWVWPGGRPVVPSQQTVEQGGATPSAAQAPNLSGNAPNPSGQMPAPQPEAAPEAATPPEPAAAMSSLQVDCQHNFRSATMELSADGKTIYAATLKGEPKSFGFVKVTRGSLQKMLPVRAGKHKLRVHVRAADEKFDEQSEIEGDFAARGSSTLVIEFGKGSALGFSKRHLSLRWK